MKRIFALTAATALASSSTLALAQTPLQCQQVCQAALEQQVVCSVPIDPDAPGTVAVISGAEGQILQAATEGMSPIPGTQAGLTIGHQIILTEGSEASLTDGPTCQAQLMGPAVLNVVAVNSCGCITYSPEVPTTVDIPSEFIIGGVIAGGIGLIFLLSDDDNGRLRIPVTP